MKITIEGEPKEIAALELALKYGKKHESYSIKMDNGSASTDMKRLIGKYPENFTGEILHSLRVQTSEQKAAERESIPRQIKGLKELAIPLIKWIREHHTPYTEILVSWDAISVKQEGIRIPFPYSEK